MFINFMSQKQKATQGYLSIYPVLLLVVVLVLLLLLLLLLFVDVFVVVVVFAAATCLVCVFCINL